MKVRQEKMEDRNQTGKQTETMEFRQEKGGNWTELRKKDEIQTEKEG